MIDRMENQQKGDATPAVFRPALRKIDVLSSDAFHESLRAAMEGKLTLVLDLSEVQFIDSSGLGKIMAGLRAFRASGGEMRICGVQPPVRVLFSMVRLAEIVGIDPDVESAVIALAAPPK